MPFAEKKHSAWKIAFVICIVFYIRFQKLTKTLCLSPDEIVTLKQEVENYQKSSKPKSHVTFESDFSMSIVDFLISFECEVKKFMPDNLCLVYWE